MASYKDYKTVSAAQKAGSMYFIGKDGKKKLAVTAEQLKAWKKKNKGKFKGSALTAWANNKGKDIKGVLRPKARPSSKKPQGPTLSGVMTLDEKIEVDQANADNDAEERRLGGQKDPAVITAERALRELEAEEADYKKNLKREGATAETFEQRKKLEEMITITEKALREFLEEGTSAEALKIRQKLRDLRKQRSDENKSDAKTAMKFSKAAKNRTFSKSNTRGKPGSRSGLAKGGMTKKNVMSYNLGGMVKSQTNNLKRK